MYSWLDCFDSNHSDTFPGLVDARVHASRTSYCPLPATTSRENSNRRSPPYPPRFFSNFHIYARENFAAFNKIFVEARLRFDILWAVIEVWGKKRRKHLFLFSKTPLLNHGFRIFPRIIFSVANRPTIFFRSRLVNLHPFLFPPLETISSSFEYVPSPAVFLYSQSLQLRRSFFATLHPLLLRAPLPSFTSLFRHYEQFVVCPPLPSPTSPSRVLLRASLSAFVTATNASFYFSSRTFFTRHSL